MKKFAGLLLSLLIVSAASLSAEKIKFDTKDFNGKQVTESVFADKKVTMINVWGTFCGPCIREMPYLAKISKEYKDKSFQIIGIPIDIIGRGGKLSSKEKKDADRILSATKADYVNLIPTMDMFSSFLNGIQAVPATIFVDNQGNQLGQIYFGARSQKEWQKIIDSLLEEAK
ncbi:TlpA disulfide reductase family protein [Treponema sp.]|uniref:TlpA family protein disulfide reductase n=1 Tax=Treponema sp. TaxID=166 RepID=UPI0025F70C2B|nr:TlpA disulfide reductase family protein [Treponema sp.]MCR5218986.1 TlpA family protein disulfide reductase [Treponema sp.]